MGHLNSKVKTLLSSEEKDLNYGQIEIKTITVKN